MSTGRRRGRPHVRWWDGVERDIRRGQVKNGSPG